MIKKLFILLCLCCIGIGSAWGDSFSTTYSYGNKDLSVTNYTDKGDYYLVPSENDPSVATISNLFTDKEITSSVVITLNVATFGSGSNPQASNFSIYNSSDCSTSVTATQGGNLPNSSTYANVTYTVSQTNAASFTKDLAIKITKPGKQIRLKSIKVEFSYSLNTKPIGSLVISGTPNKTTFTEGDEFDPTGLIVTANYTDGTNENVTSKAEISCTPSILSLGITNVTVKASYANSNSSEYIVPVTVNPYPEKTIADFIKENGGKCYLTGFVSDIVNTTYGNFNLTDASGTIYVYGCLDTNGDSKQFSTLDVEEGDKIKVFANKYTLFNETPEAVDVRFVEEIAVQKHKINIVTPIDNGKIVADMDEAGEGMVVTLTPTPNMGYKLGAITVMDASGNEISVANNKFTMPASDVTVTASFVEKVKYTITWMANGEVFVETEVIEGEKLVKPTKNPANIGDFKFQGWIASENYYNATTAPTSYVDQTLIPESNMTICAVYAKETMMEGPASITINTETKNFPTAYGTANAFTDYTLEGYTFAIQQAYINGTKLQWRAAGNSNGTGTMYNKDAFNKIQSILIKYAEGDSNKNFTVSVGSTANPTEGTSITPKVSEMYNYTFDCSDIAPDYFVLTNGANAGYLSEIVINYIDLVSTTTDYTTSIADANMSITSAKWGTFCAPFDVELDEDVKAYTASEDNGIVKFEEVNGTIEAGTPVVVYKDVTETYTKDYSAAVEDFNETCQKDALVGVYTATSDIPATTATNQNYVLQKNAAGVGFYKANNNISLKANRCYMTLPATSGAKESFLFDEVVTGINTILNNKDKSVEGIFDLNGRRLPAPRKGVNIINGVKVIVK